MGPFRNLLQTHRLPQELADPSVALGHTRWATQGGRGLEQASPLAVGSLLGTHNGDVDPATIPGAARLPLGRTATDSHYLLRAIASDRGWQRGDTDRLGQILATIHGRAALVWTDAASSDCRVWLARGGLSPLTVGIDQHGGRWWASNPGWLRHMAGHNALQMTITLLPEGSLWVLDPRQRQVTCTQIAEFTPTVRRSDEAIAPVAVWRGFTMMDQAHVQTLLRHRTVA